MRTNLTVEDLGDLLDRPLIAVLATLRTDGTVLLSPVYHEWRYEGPEEAATDVEAVRGGDVIVRVEPGDIHAWDYADELGAG